MPCLICDEGNTLDAETCRNCYAPMILAHQAQSQSTPPVMFAALGPSGVGKTVYLGMLLDMLSRQPKQLQLSARGGFSVTLQQNTLAALARCEFPEQDAQRARSLELGPLPVAQPQAPATGRTGHARHRRRGPVRGSRSSAFVPVIHSLLSRCDGVLILIDGTKLQSGSLDEDYFTMKLLSHLSELPNDPKSTWC